MNKNELKSVLSLSSIMSLRMVGLFMVLPIFAIYAIQLPHATPTLVGFAIGIYGLAQAVFQIPFGTLSDRFGRKPVITFGLLIFVLGSLLAAIAHSIFLLILGRALQGVGAVGGTLLAFLADLTRVEQRTKAMAIAGISIGASFSIAMFLGPVLSQWFPVNQLFFISALSGLLAIFILYSIVPEAPLLSTTESAQSFFALLITPELARLNLGILFLHAIFTATFVVLPINLVHLANLSAQTQWHLYLPTLICACVISLICIGIAERKQKIKSFFVISIICLGCAMVLFWMAPAQEPAIILGLILFFSGFSILEAFLPSLISRTAPPAHKGSALGLYSCAQFSGIFVGGFMGGWLNSQFHFPGVYLFCIFLSLFWLFMAFSMQKTERTAKQHPDFIRLKEQLQSKSS